MKSVDEKQWLTRRRFIRATAGIVGVTGASYGGYSLWRRQGESAYQASLNRTRGVIDESKLLTKIVRYATLAPNSHNTQPWIFEASNENITIRPDFSRRCSVVDPDDHHLFVSLGCACENAVLAGEAFGRHSEVTFDESNSTLRIDMEAQSPVPSERFNAILIRQTADAANSSLQQLIDERIDAALERLGIARTEDVNALLHRIELLEKSR
jgi:Poly(hydroxyalcanoate) granule associated protein (phasin)